MIFIPCQVDFTTQSVDYAHFRDWHVIETQVHSPPAGIIF